MCSFGGGGGVETGFTLGTILCVLHLKVEPYHLDE
jgi:hypothetical protein